MNLRLTALTGGSPEAERWNEAWEAPEAGPLLYTDMPSTTRTHSMWAERLEQSGASNTSIISVIKLPRSAFRAAKGQVLVIEKIDTLLFFVFNS